MTRLADYPTERMVALHEPTAERLKRLTGALEPVALRRPHARADPETLRLARSILGDVVRITSRVGGARLLPIGGSPTLAGLLALLVLASAQLDVFRSRFRPYDWKRNEHVWMTRERVAGGAATPPARKRA